VSYRVSVHDRTKFASVYRKRSSFTANGSCGMGSARVGAPVVSQRDDMVQMFGACAALTREFSPTLEEIMGRKFIDCRAFPSEMNCTIALSADSEAE
jgi:hypothetical protein